MASALVFSTKPKDKETVKINNTAEKMLETIHGILNELTPSQFHELLERIHALNFCTEDQLSGMITLFFEKVAGFPILSPICAQMCQALLTKQVASSANPAEPINFHKLLLARCQKEFESSSAGIIDVEIKKKEITSPESEQKRKELEEELEELIDNRRRSIGKMRFMGELFKLGILPVKVMHQCMHILLLCPPEDEEALECICLLLPTMGKALELAKESLRKFASNQEIVNWYFSSLDAIIQKRNISNRIRIMIQEIVDLRNRQWEPLSDDEHVPRGIEQMHKDGQSRSRNIGNNGSAKLSVEKLLLAKASRNADQEAISSVPRSIGRGSCRRETENMCLEDGTHESGKTPFFGRFRLGCPPQGRRCQTMSGAAKTAFFPTENGDCRLNSIICSQNPNILLGKPSTDDEIERKAHSLLREFFMNHIENTVLNMKEWLHISIVTRFINQCLLYVLQRNRTERRAMGTLFKEMVKRKLFSASDIMEGFTELLQSAEDFLVYIPRLWEYMAELVEPLFEEGVINLNFLGHLSSTLILSLADNFVAAVLKEFLKAQGIAEVKRLWILSNAAIANVLPSCIDANTFLAQHKELEFLSKIDSAPVVDGLNVVNNGNRRRNAELGMSVRNAGSGIEEPREPRFSGEFVRIDQNSIFMENEQVNGIQLVTDYKRVREMQVLLGRYAKGPLNVFPVMSGISLPMKKLSMLETEPFIVSPKPTGRRCLMYVNASGQIFLENMTQHIFLVDNMKMVNCDGQPITDTVLDGIMTREKTDANGCTTNKGKLTFVIMDAIRCNGVSLIDLNILQRIARVKVEIMYPWLEAQMMSSSENAIFNFDIVEPKEFYLADDYLSEGFANCYKYQLSCFNFLPLQMGYKCGGTRRNFFKWAENDYQECSFRLKVPAPSTGRALVADLYVVGPNAIEVPLATLALTQGEIKELDGRIVDCRYVDHQWILTNVRNDRSHPNSKKCALEKMKALNESVSPEHLLAALDEAKEVFLEPIVFSAHCVSIFCVCGVLMKIS